MLHGVYLENTVCRHRGREEKGIVVMTYLSHDLGLIRILGYVAESLDKTLYDDYLCLVDSNKQ